MRQLGNRLHIAVFTVRCEPGTVVDSPCGQMRVEELLLTLEHALGNGGKRFFPADLDPARILFRSLLRIGPAKWLFQAVRVIGVGVVSENGK